MNRPTGGERVNMDARTFIILVELEEQCRREGLSGDVRCRIGGGLREILGSLVEDQGPREKNERDTCVNECMGVDVEGMKKSERTSEQLRQAIRDAEKAGISRYRLSMLSGVSQGQISRFFTAGRGLSLDAFDRLAHALDLELTHRKGR